MKKTTEEREEELSVAIFNNRQAYDKLIAAIDRNLEAAKKYLKKLNKF